MSRRPISRGADLPPDDNTNRPAEGLSDWPLLELLGALPNGSLPGPGVHPLGRSLLRRSLPGFRLRDLLALRATALCGPCGDAARRCQGLVLAQVPPVLACSMLARDSTENDWWDAGATHGECVALTFADAMLRAGGVGEVHHRRLARFFNPCQQREIVVVVGFCRLVIPLLDDTGLARSAHRASTP